MPSCEIGLRNEEKRNRWDGRRRQRLTKGLLISISDGIPQSGASLTNPRNCVSAGYLTLYRLQIRKPQRQRAMGLSNLVLLTGFEPAIFAVRGRCPEPLDDRSRQRYKIPDQQSAFVRRFEESDSKSNKRNGMSPREVQ